MGYLLLSSPGGTPHIPARSITPPASPLHPRTPGSPGTPSHPPPMEGALSPCAARRGPPCLPSPCLAAAARKGHPGVGAGRGAPRTALPHATCARRDSWKWGEPFSESQQRKSITAKMLWLVPRRNFQDLLFVAKCCQKKKCFRPAQAVEKLIPGAGSGPSARRVNTNFIACN